MKVDCNKPPPLRVFHQHSTFRQVYTSPYVDVVCPHTCSMSSSGTRSLHFPIHHILQQGAVSLNRLETLSDPDLIHCFLSSSFCMSSFFSSSAMKFLLSADTMTCKSLNVALTLLVHCPFFCTLKQWKVKKTKYRRVKDLTFQTWQKARW